MDFAYAYTPYIWPMLASAAWLGALAFYSWRHRRAPGALPLVAVTLIGMLIAVASAFELAAVGMAVKTNWFLVRTATSIPIGVAAVWFVLDYGGQKRWATPGILTLLLSPVLPQVLLYLLDPDHSLLWERVWLDGIVRADFGPVSAAIAVYTSVLMVTSLAIMLALLVRSPLHRWPVRFMLLGLLAVLLIYEFQTAHLVSAPVNLTVLAADFAGLTFAIAVVRYRFFSIVPIACETVFERTKDGLIVINADNRVVDMNRAAEQILGVPRRETIGQSLAVAVARLPDLLQLEDGPGVSEIEVVVGQNGETRRYQATVDPLTSDDGFHYGRTVTLRDITELKRAQDNLTQDMRVLATLQERERVARELHDVLSQELAFINLQAQAARDALAAGKSGEADGHIDRVGAVARDAHSEVRWLISGLTATIAPDGGLRGALGSLVDDFRRRYDMEVEFLPPANPKLVSLEPPVAMQLMRIVQEALANVRKHACAQRVRVQLRTRVPGVRVTIEDDGCGFDTQVLGDEEKTYGLAIMRQRAQEIGAALAVDSTPGKGTRIVVHLPETAAHEIQPERQEG